MAPDIDKELRCIEVIFFFNFNQSILNSMSRAKTGLFEKRPSFNVKVLQGGEKGTYRGDFRKIKGYTRYLLRDYHSDNNCFENAIRT